MPLQRTLLDICKVVTFAQTEGRVAIHCHAGLGRTGVVIACFLVYHHKLKPKDVSNACDFLNGHVIPVGDSVPWGFGLLGIRGVNPYPCSFIIDFFSRSNI